LLLFLLLNKLTGALWSSFFVAAFFAWHPLHVESVAWAAERKDVLSAFFWMLTILCYAKAVTNGKCRVTRAGNGPAPIVSPVICHPSLFYFLALFFFACGLMSKPMVVTLPFVLLLLDFWPLQRFSNSTIQRLVLEKIPFFALAIAGSVVTYLVQKSGGATWSQGSLPFHARIANALVSYARYISKTFWPADLAVIYPYPHHWPMELVIGAALLLAVWSALFIWRARQNPYLLVGWLWFLGTLVPAIGLVQVGAASIADRYTYIPSIGLFIAIVWGANDFLNRWPEWKKFLPLAGGVALAGCLMVTSVQLNYWRNSITLLTHTIEVTTDNYTACNFLGRALDDAGQNGAAIFFYAESVGIAPRYPEAQYNLGMDLWRQGRLDEAGDHLAAAVRLVPDEAVARYYYAELLAQQHNTAGAIYQYREALRLTPDFPQAKKELDEILAAHPELR
jgi:tetratricopeptide (TPR) repeat protein